MNHFNIDDRERITWWMCNQQSSTAQAIKAEVVGKYKTMGIFLINGHSPFRWYTWLHDMGLKAKATGEREKRYPTTWGVTQSRRHPQDKTVADNERRGGGRAQWHKRFRVCRRIPRWGRIWEKREFLSMDLDATQISYCDDRYLSDGGFRIHSSNGIWLHWNSAWSYTLVNIFLRTLYPYCSEYLSFSWGTEVKWMSEFYALPVAQSSIPSGYEIDA
jgi:hypothetical protein